MKTEILYGVHPIEEAIAAGRRKLVEIYRVPSRSAARLETILAAAETADIPVKTVPASHLMRLSGSDQHQGVGAKTSCLPPVDLDRAVPRCNDVVHAPLVLLLDNVMDPHNLGALARTALGVGVSAIILPKDRSAGPSPAVSKVSAGAVEHLPIARVTNLVNALNRLKEKGYWVVGLDHRADRSVYDSDLTGPLALVIGGEGRGLRPLVKRHCDYRIAIPQLGQVRSLNASVAGGVVLYEIFRQRQTVPPKQVKG